MCLKLNPNLTCLPADCYSDPTEFQANMYDKKKLKNPKFLKKERKKKKELFSYNSWNTYLSQRNHQVNDLVFKY